jgi:hypothetical protein
MGSGVSGGGTVPVAVGVVVGVAVAVAVGVTGVPLSAPYS